MNRTDNLFVYGTLMGDIDSSIARFLRKNSRFLGEYQIRGRLYDLGQYPGLVVDPDCNDLVTGHLFQLKNVPITLGILDRYEAIFPGEEADCEYRRELVSVFREGDTQNTWTYVYNYPLADQPQIHSGNYLDYLKDNDSHQQFIKSV